MASISSVKSENLSTCSRYVPLPVKSGELLAKLNDLNKSYFFMPGRALVNELKTVDIPDLSKILHNFFIHATQDKNFTDPVEFLDRLATILPLDRLQQALEGGPIDALEEAKKMIEEARLYLDSTENRSFVTIKGVFASALDAVIYGVDNIRYFFKNPDSYSIVDKSLQVIIFLFSMITAMIVSAFSLTIGGLVLGGALLVIVILSSIWPYIKPMPSQLPASAENWTKEIQNGSRVDGGRKTTVNEIANIIGMNRNVILIGAPGVGKNWTVKAFAQAVHDGEYPLLKGKVVFCINAANVIGQEAAPFGEGNDILSRISTLMGRHRENIVLVIRNVHLICKSNDEKVNSQFQQFLGESGEFRHVVGIATETEYESYIEGSELDRFFDRVLIENTNEDETLKILGNALLKMDVKPVLDDDVLEYIYQKTVEADEDAPQPLASLRLLKDCIHAVEKSGSARENRVIEITDTIASLRSRLAVGSGERKELRTRISQLEADLEKLRREMFKEKMDLEKLSIHKKLFNKVREQSFRSILKIANASPRALSAKDEKQLIMFLLLHKFLQPLLFSMIKRESANLKVNAIINRSLVDQVASDL